MADSFEVTNQEFVVKPIGLIPNRVQQYSLDDRKQTFHPNIIYVASESEGLSRDEIIKTTLFAIAGITTTLLRLGASGWGPGTAPLIKALAREQDFLGLLLA